MSSNISFPPSVRQEHIYNGFAPDLIPMEDASDRQPGDPTRRVLGPRVVSDAANGAQDSFKGIIGSSSPLKNVLKQVRTLAPTDPTGLSQAETGNGKALIARAIHSISS